MINENEIRIGNWFDCPGRGNHQWNVLDWVSQYNTDHIDNFLPIPLDEKWLEKLGFTYSNSLWKKGEFTLFEDSGYLFEVAFEYLQAIEIQYVHELQNLYFAITRNEL